MKKLLLLSVCLAFAGAMLPSNALAVTSLGTGTGALLGGDLTDPDNNINDNVPASPNGGSGFNWVSATATTEPWFSPGIGSEGAFDVFDNKVGGGETKWCCAGPTQSVTVQLPERYVLTHFTIAAGNDVPGRDPDVWFIEGSEDGSNWTTIFSYDNDGVSPFAQRFEVLRYDGDGDDFARPGQYNWYRYRVTSTVIGNHQINEIELFGDFEQSVIPTLGPFGLLILALLLGTAGALLGRRLLASRAG